MSALSALVLCLMPVAVDGDTLHCSNRKSSLRITGIDSPEMPGHCRTGRVCAPGDPVKAKESLAVILATGKVRYRPLKRDLYGRTVAVVYANRVNVSCAQISSGNAIYKPAWDTAQIVKKECGL